MIITQGKSKWQVKNIDGIYYCLNFKVPHGLMKLTDVYDIIIFTENIPPNNIENNFFDGVGGCYHRHASIKINNNPITYKNKLIELIGGL